MVDVSSQAFDHRESSNSARRYHSSVFSEDPTPFSVRVVGVFDLGLLVATAEREDGQLRALDMKPARMKIHVEGRDHELIGTTVEVFMMLTGEHGFRVSEWSPAERKATRDAERAREHANASVAIGTELVVVVRSAYSWGYLCDVVDGLATGAMFTKESDLGAEASAAGCIVPVPGDLAIGQRLVARVLGKNPNHGALVLGLVRPGAAAMD